MAQKTETTSLTHDGLAAAIAELESTAIERAQILVSEEVQALREQIWKLEQAVLRLQSRPQPTSAPQTITPKPGGASSQPLTPEKRPEPRLRTAKMSRPRELPPLPPKRSLATLKEYLQGLGFTLVSYRASGGGAWVFNTQEEFGHVVEHLKKNGIGVSRYPRGRKRYSGDHFEIDPSKVLPDK